MRWIVLVLVLLAAPRAFAKEQPSLDVPPLQAPTFVQQESFVAASAGTSVATTLLVFTFARTLVPKPASALGGLWIGLGVATLLDIPLHMLWGKAFGLPVSLQTAVIGASCGAVAALLEGALLFSGAAFDSPQLFGVLYVVVPLFFVTVGAPLLELTVIARDRGDEGARQLDAVRESAADAWLSRALASAHGFGVPLAHAAF